MKNKTKTYFLLILVLCIWGTVAYRVVKGINPELPESSIEDFEMKYDAIKPTQLDTFSVASPNRDPFLGTVSVSKKSKKSNINVIKKVAFPNIVYRGMISNQNTKQRLFVIEIKGNQYNMKLGQEVDSVKIVTGNDKSIKVKYKSKFKDITIE